MDTTYTTNDMVDIGTLDTTYTTPNDMVDIGTFDTTYTTPNTSLGDHHGGLTVGKVVLGARGIS